MPYEIKLEKFEGPLALLLKLVEQEKLPIAEVFLGRVTESFLDYINTSVEISEEELADFLVVATKLLYIKSKNLLPEPLVELEDGLSLEDQLRMYKEFVEAAKRIEEIIKKKGFSYFRDVLLKLNNAGFYPPKGLNSDKMKRMFKEVLERLKPLIDLPRAAFEKVMSIKEKIQQIENLLKNFKELRFSHLFNEAGSRTELIIIFLALLELTKQRHVAIFQENNFEEIIISRV